MRKIAIDITHYNRFSGYGVVTRNIIKGLLEKDKENFYYLFSNEEKNLDDLKDFKNFKFINTCEGFIKYKFFSLSKYLEENNIDVFLSLDQDLPLKKACKYICISHDIGAQIKGKLNMIKQLLTPGTNKLDRVYHLLDLEKISLNKADLIFTPSENTKNDIIKHYRIPKNKIIVNYWGIDHLKNENKFEKGDCILFPYSNLYSNFQYELANKILENKLVSKILFLRPAYIDNNIILNKNIEIIKGPILPKNNEKFYKESVISIYLSDYDGFGFVPLESMFYQVPVIYNIHSCMEEISSDGGIGIKKLDIDIFYEKIRNLLINKKENIKLINKGNKNIEKYKWENNINIILNSLNKI